MKNQLELKTINEILDYSFFIPSYQRGYRWAKNEILDLLNDINEFSPKEVANNEKTWYCLQPIVLKKRNDNEYEVIDGQQRLTTIYQILFHLNQYLADDYKVELFKLSFETRTNSEKFLLNLKENSYTNTTESNIDFYYISEAYKTIEKWFKDQGNKFNRFDFDSKLKFYTKLIWFESQEVDSISIFTRINIGKIPLTNSELIKALFLNSSNFETTSFQRIKLRQLEISTEWDLIEQSLQKDKFWFFLTNSKIKVNRIEYIFNLMNNSLDKDDKYSTFRFFSDKFKNKNTNTIDVVWKEIKTIYQTFNEWYENRELYHKIGFLLTLELIQIEILYKQSIEKTKTDFVSFIDHEIRESIKSIDINELSYDHERDKLSIKKVLILYNILTLLNSKSENSYFPFDLLKTEEWDIEHINSITDPTTIKDKNSREKWVNDSICFIDIEKHSGKKLREKIIDFNKYEDDKSFNDIFSQIVSHFNSHIESEGDLNHISNLTLLDSSTNRGYKNAVFPVKRKIIIDKDKQGVFIPICTKNLFLKYFSEYPPKISFWTQEDRENYKKDLYNTIEKYTVKDE